MKTKINDLFSQFCRLNNMPNYNELKNTRGIKCLKLDFNPVYGGYRIDIVHENTGESFWHNGERVQRKLMVAYLQGFIDGKMINN